MEAARFLLHAQIAATDADIQAVRNQGRAAWLDTQLATPMGERAWAWLEAKGYAAIDEFRFYDNSTTCIDFVTAYEFVQQDSVRRRVSLALSEYFVVNVPGVFPTWAHLSVAHFWDQLNEIAFGNFQAACWKPLL